MSISLAGLRSLIRERLPSTAAWSDSNLTQWILDAIADYSKVFPQTELTATIDCAAGVREYDLVAELVSPHVITSVEYPAGEDPPVYLTRCSHRDPRGFVGGAYYDVLGAPPATLVIGEEPLATEDIVVTYSGDHAYPSADGDLLTVPDQDMEALTLFAIWKAAELLRAVEGANPRFETLLLTQFDSMVYRAEVAYRAWLRGAREQVSQTAFVSWEGLGL